jgi:hypothetical protein
MCAATADQMDDQMDNNQKLGTINLTAFLDGNGVRMRVWLGRKNQPARQM